ncbi:nuclear transport factor 2 family protein [Sphingomonas piscis]|uniref:Nuclear transport factor 2 family protein n=1 Tax=Sphingomonas piscis TaxID=2714943 RepID=A0A6G7YQY1_9SPHN|nr:nuclear transport factor 2 family protein [Sphingomonas piscis]QIK79150.1 nuclear transport factor 2 family protein [Sphingomonas piscis]
MAGDCALIAELENEWRDALCAKDMDRLSALIHPDFVLIGTRSTGAFTMSREEWLDAIQKRDPLTIELKVHQATVLDKVMVGTIHARWKLKYLGREIEDCVLLTDVWAFDEGRWRVVRRHSTPAPTDICAN